MSDLFTKTIEDRLFWSIKETAHKLGVSRSTVYRLLYTGELYSIKVGGSRRIPVDAILSLFEDGLEADIAQRRARWRKDNYGSDRN